MTRMTRDIIAFVSIDVFCERLFFIASRQYASHKFYHFDIIRALMIIRQYDLRKNEFEQCHVEWETKELESSKKYKLDQAQQDENLNALREQQFINDDEKTKVDRINWISSLFLILYYTKIKFIQTKVKKRAHFARESTSQRQSEIVKRRNLSRDN